MNDHRVDPEVDRLWDEFHSLVTMSSDELLRWLQADAAGFPGRPDVAVAPAGHRVLRVLTKRKYELGPEDVAVMRRTVDQILDLLSVRGARDERWRHALMDLGHDPFKDGFR